MIFRVSFYIILCPTLVGLLEYCFSRVLAVFAVPSRVYVLVCSNNIVFRVVVRLSIGRRHRLCVGIEGCWTHYTGM